MHLPSAFQRFDTTNLRLRVISASIMAPVALLAVYLGGVIFGAVVTATLTIGLYEWFHLVAPKMNKKTIGLACSLLVILMAVGSFSPLAGAILAALTTLLIFLFAWHDRDENAAWIAFGIPYLAASGLALLTLRTSPVWGMEILFFLLAVVWGTDVGAFVSGSIIGGPKLAPKISPSKTWAGLFGGMAFATLFGFAVAALGDARHVNVAVLLAPALAVVSQLGDLFESHMKRRADVKESGDLIPGHGGVLDRIDGLVFASIALFLFQALIGDNLSWW